MSNERQPRIYLHPDKLYFSVGVDDSNDTLFKLPDPNESRRDYARAIQWIEAVSRALREREVFRQALADIYTGRLGDEPLFDPDMANEAIDKRVHRALFVDTEPPNEGYPR